MFDPNDVIEIEVEGVGKFKTRLMTERQLKEFNRVLAKSDGKATIESHHENLNAALLLGLVDADLEGLTLAQKVKLADEYPWAVTNAELDRAKKASGSHSESPTV